MAASITVEFETASGDTQNATQALGALRWETGRVTLRRRAPHTFDFVIPRAPGTHRVADFVAGRELRIKKDAAHWLAGFMGAPSISGGSQGGAITLPGWGNAYALMLARNSAYAGVIGHIILPPTDVDAAITTILDTVEHGSGGDWFPLAGRTLGASATTFTSELPLIGKSALEHLNDLVDIEGWAWRAGIDASGAFTFKASATVEQDLTSSVRLFDGANCRIVDWRQDGSRVTAQAVVASKRPALDTRLAAGFAAGVTTIALDSDQGLAEDDTIAIGVGTANQESRTVSSASGSGSVVLTAATGFAHAADDVVKQTQAGTHRATFRTAAASVAQAHHLQQEVWFDDTLSAKRAREERGDAYLTAYDHVQRSATLDTTDARLIDILLTAAAEPGDTVKLTTADPDLDDYYSDTTVKIQELTYELAAGAVTRATLTLGDPRVDDLAALERKLAAGRNVAIGRGGG